MAKLVEHKIDSTANGDRMRLFGTGSIQHETSNYALRAMLIEYWYIVINSTSTSGVHAGEVLQEEPLPLFIYTYLFIV